MPNPVINDPSQLRKRQQLQRLINKLPKSLRRHAFLRFINSVVPNTDCQLIIYNDCCRAFIDVSDPNPRNYLLKGSFEPDLILLGVIFGDPICIDLDIGANFGLWGLGLISNQEYKGKGVHFFEANTHCHKFLAKSLAELYDSNSIAINAAVGKSNGYTYLSVDRNELGRSFISQSDAGIKVQVISLDSYICRIRNQPIGVVKMDIEGYEVEALKGMETILKNMPPRSFILECCNSHFKRYGTNSRELILILKKHGYSLFLFRQKDLENAEYSNLPEFMHAQKKGLRLKRIESYVSANYGTDILALRHDVCSALLQKAGTLV